MKLSFVQKFLQLQSASGIILLLMAVIALVLSNSPLSVAYQQFFQLPLTFQLGEIVIEKSLSGWINDGLMVIFFLVVGLELKREFFEGSLTQSSQLILSGVAALGGMLVPAVIFLLINHGVPTAIKGWPVPVATDIAFSLGVLSLFGQRVPIGLKIFLTSLAIFDDVGAIIIIAIFHAHHLVLMYLFAVMLVFSILLLCNYLGVRRLLLYSILGIVLWVTILQSGIHATVAGILLALTIPLRSKSGGDSPLHQLEKILHPWVAYCIMPIFALANAGICFDGISNAILTDTVTLGIILGLFFGKQIGILGFSWLIIRLRWVSLPRGSSWLELYGVAILCGIGFTMSLFLGTLAFEKNPHYLLMVRLGVLLGSMLSGSIGASVLYFAFCQKRKKKGEAI